MSRTDDVGIKHLEGLDRYIANDVAAAFSEVKKREVEVQEVPRNALEDTLQQFGFSNEAAASYACMTRRVIEGKRIRWTSQVLGKPL